MSCTLFALRLAIAAVSLSAVLAAPHFCAHKPIVKLNPPTLIPADELGYSHIVVHPKTMVAHIAGQTALNVSFGIEGDTLADQLPRAARNVELALQAVSARRKDVIAMTIYTVGFSNEEHLETIKWLGIEFDRPAITLVDVKNLAIEGLFVEIEATAALSLGFLQKLGGWRCVGNTAVFGATHYHYAVPY